MPRRRWCAEGSRAPPVCRWDCRRCWWGRLGCWGGGDLWSRGGRERQGRAQASAGRASVPLPELRHLSLLPRVSAPLSRSLCAWASPPRPPISAPVQKHKQPPNFTQMHATLFISPHKHSSQRGEQLHHYHSPASKGTVTLRYWTKQETEPKPHGTDSKDSHTGDCQPKQAPVAGVFVKDKPAGGGEITLVSTMRWYAGLPSSSSVSAAGLLSVSGRRSPRQPAEMPIKQNTMKGMEACSTFWNTQGSGWEGRTTGYSNHCTSHDTDFSTQRFFLHFTSKQGFFLYLTPNLSHTCFGINIMAQDKSVPVHHTMLWSVSTVIGIPGNILYGV